jgi:6-phosphofructokinase 1
MEGRIKKINCITNERKILLNQIERGGTFETDVPLIIGAKVLPNAAGDDRLGSFRAPTARKSTCADGELLRAFRERNVEVPAFLAAGPRAELRHNPQKIRAAIVTTGGLAPGMHSVIHSIVKRHCEIYSIDKTNGEIFGVYDSFKGLSNNLADNLVALEPSVTEEWLDHGGSMLGMVRYYGEGGPDRDGALASMVQKISANLQNNDIDILYIIGGDGSLKVAHQLALANPTRSIVGIPKTMDNDILWVERSFGFDTAVEQAADIVNTMHTEAMSTRRICLIELFGAESGFVAANATLASGHVDLVLIPEVFLSLKADEIRSYLQDAVDHIQETVQGAPSHSPHAVIVVAEGVGTVLEEKQVSIDGTGATGEPFVNQLRRHLESRIRDAHGDMLSVFINQPRHHIRAVAANAHDRIFCERLGALSVDNALAGYTDFMVSEWLTEFVLVPLSLMGDWKKGVDLRSMFWKQVISSTGQPLSPAERS